MAEQKKGTVLVVDDDPGLLKSASALLEKEYQVRLAPSGTMALRLLREGEPPDVILLDIDMPGLDGYGTMAEIKKLEPCRDVPVIFLTALTDRENQLRGWEAGAADYVCKPFDADLLLLLIAKRLDTGRRLRQKDGIPPARKEQIQPLLSAQELKAADWVAQGKSNKEIAAMLGVSTRRAENIIHNIHIALGTGSREELRRYLREEIQL